SVIVLLTTLAVVTDTLAPAERFAEDLRTRVLAERIDSDVLIVAIDADTLHTLERWPWPRSVHAELMAHLDSAGPRAVLLDIDFSAPSGDPAADQALIDALARPRPYPVVLPAFWQNASAGSRAG